MDSHIRGAKPLLRALRGEVCVPPPFWLMRQAGRYLPEYRELRKKAGSFLDFCYSPELAVEASLQPWHRFCPDGVIVFSDILVLVDALGVSITFEEGEGPILKPLDWRALPLDLKLSKLHRHLAPVYETLGRLKAELSGTSATLIGFAGAPWTIATYMVEGGASRSFQQTKAFRDQEPAAFGKLIETLVEAVAVHLINQAEAGAECLQLFDSWAGALEGEAFERWCIAPTRAIVGKLRSAFPDVPVIGFPRGAGGHYLDYARCTGVNAVSLDESISLGFARDELQPLVAVQGNLDPEALVEGGARLKREAEAILRALGDGPFVFNLGHGVRKETNPEHVAELASLIRGWRGGKALEEGGPAGHTAAP